MMTDWSHSAFGGFPLSRTLDPDVRLEGASSLRISGTGGGVDSAHDFYTSGNFGDSATIRTYFRTDTKDGNTRIGVMGSRTSTTIGYTAFVDNTTTMRLTRDGIDGVFIASASIASVLPSGIAVGLWYPIAVKWQKDLNSSVVIVTASIGPAGSGSYAGLVPLIVYSDPSGITGTRSAAVAVRESGTAKTWFDKTQIITTP